MVKTITVETIIGTIKNAIVAIRVKIIIGIIFVQITARSFIITEKIIVKNDVIVRRVRGVKGVKGVIGFIIRSGYIYF
jgi:hypothetical protein